VLLIRLRLPIERGLSATNGPSLALQSFQEINGFQDLIVPSAPEGFSR
jgi:hypothetical protein